MNWLVPILLLCGCAPKDRRAAMVDGDGHRWTAQKLCQANNRVVILTALPQAGVDDVLELLDPIGAELACLTETEYRADLPACYHLRLPRSMRCSEAGDYFGSSEVTPIEFTVRQPNPAWTCDCIPV